MHSLRLIAALPLALMLSACDSSEAKKAAPAKTEDDKADANKAAANKADANKAAVELADGEQTNNDKVTLTTTSCSSGCSSAPTVTATPKSSGKGVTCTDGCCVQTSTSSADFTFTSANDVKFKSDSSCQNDLSSASGSRATFYVYYKNDSGCWTCADPTISVQTGVCGGSADDD
ncbi:MAG: hypothetical protein AAF799_21235 [Myxococcota bacterium]